MKESVLTPERAERLRQALAAGSSLGATDMRLINIDVYRERLGAEWSKYKDIIHSYASRAIKEELGERDFFVQTKNGYAIFFFERDVAQVRLVSERVAAKVDQDLAGDAAFGDPPLTCRAVSVNCAELLAQLEGNHQPPLDRALLAQHTAAASGQEPEQKRASVYAPLWHAKLERVVGSIHLPSGPPALRRASDRDYYEPSVTLVQDDLYRFNAMLSEAYKLHKAGQSTTILFSLNFKSFCESKFSKEYMQVLRQTPASLLKYLTPRFVRIPPGTPQSLLTGNVQLLTTIFKHVVLHTRAPVDLRTFEFVPCSILAMSWKDAAQTADHDTRSIEKVLTAFCQSARILRANSLIGGVDSSLAFEIATTAGAEFISGEAIASLENTPLQQRPLSLAHVRAAHGQRAAHVSHESRHAGALIGHK